MAKAKAKYEAIAEVAKDDLYSAEDVEAGVEFYKGKNRISNPPGSFDNADRFYADERTYHVNNCRTPSLAFTYSVMTAARTAAHCAELTGANDTNVRRTTGTLVTVG